MEHHPRKVAERRPALVLGGGGAFGIVQAAYIKAAREGGFAPSVVVGTSVGSLNGAWVALHPGEEDALLDIWRELDRLRLVQFNPMRMAARLVRRPLGLCSNDIVPRLIGRHLGSRTFADTELDFAVVATSLSRGVKHVFERGPLSQAILASTAIPGVYEPVEIDGELFVDGGISASVDLATALRMGATEILAIDLTPAPSTHRPKTLVGVLKLSFDVLQHATTDAMEACISHQVPVRVIRPDLSAHSPWRLDDSAAAVERNLALARSEMAGVLDSEGRLREAPSERTAPIDIRQYMHLRAKRQAG